MPTAVLIGCVDRHWPRLVLNGQPSGATSPSERWANLPDVLALAKYPNVAMKATGAPSYSDQPYPFRDIHDQLRQLYDAFGPARWFWGTDITRMPCPWRQCVTPFTEELPWLRGCDLELVMGRASPSRVASRRRALRRRACAGRSGAATGPESGAAVGSEISLHGVVVSLQRGVDRQLAELDS